jgi:hypothetical protein
MFGTAALLSLGLLAVVLLPISARAAPGAGFQVRADESYRVMPLASGGAAPHGWGVFATVQGRSIDIRSRDLGWSDDPHTRAGDIEAGFGWRRDRVSAVLGYQQIDFGYRSDPAPGQDPKNQPGAHWGGGGVLGLGFALRSR